MTSGTELQTLKVASIAAKKEFDRYKNSRLKLIMGMMVAGIVFSLLTINLSSVGLLAANGAVMLTASASPIVVSMMMLRSGPGKRSKELLDAASAASLAFMEPMYAEMNEYGIDTSSIMNAAGSSPEADAYEFTALRNGFVSDISVKTFNSKLVFLMNGQEMTKALTTV